MNTSYPITRTYSISGRKFIEPLYLGSLVVISVLLGIFRIGVGEQHVDVYQVMGVFNLSWGQLLTEFFTQPTGLYGGFQAPVYFLLAKAYGTVFGSDVTQLAIFSVIALVLLVLLSWFVYPLLTKDTNRQRRFLFAFLVAASPVHIWWAQTAKYDMWFTLVSAISIATGLWFIQKRDTPRLILFSITVAATIYTHYFGFILLAAQFCTLGLLALYRRDKSFAYRIVVAGILVAILIAPLLPVAFQATRLRQAEQYHFTEENIGTSNIIRGVLVEWLFGYGLIAHHGVGVQITQAFQIALKGEIVQAILLLKDTIVLLLAALVIVSALLYTVYKVIKQESIRENAVYVVGVPLLALAFSQVAHMAFRFSYLSVGTWCILAFVAVGLAYAKRLFVPLTFAIGMILLYAVSLTTYYQNMDLRYPGMGLVANYLNDHASDFQVVLIDRWIIDNRGSDGEYHLPFQLPLYKIDKVSDIPRSEIQNKNTIAFVSGRPEQVQSNLDALKATTPNFSWMWLQSWMSMEMSERSINAVQIKWDSDK
jgi:hypothetical protein